MKFFDCLKALLPNSLASQPTQENQALVDINLTLLQDFQYRMLQSLKKEKDIWGMRAAIIKSITLLDPRDLQTHILQLLTKALNDAPALDFGSVERNERLLDACKETLFIFLKNSDSNLLDDHITHAMESVTKDIQKMQSHSMANEMKVGR